MKKLNPLLPQMMILLVLIPLLFALFFWFSIHVLHQNFWIEAAFLLVVLIFYFVLFGDWLRRFRHAPVYLSADGIRVPEGLIRWGDLKISIYPLFFYRSFYLLAYFSDRPITKFEMERKGGSRNFAQLTRRDLKRIIEYYPNRFYIVSNVLPPSFTMAGGMIRMIDDHNRSVSEKQKEMNF